MDPIEKIIRENCWRFNKGYPDSQEDINYLKTLIEQVFDVNKNYTSDYII